MSRPQVIVNVTAALQRRGAPTDTGVTFFVYAGASGPSVPTECISKADALTASVPTGVADWVGDALYQGAPKVWVLRAAAVDASAVTESEWDTALAKLTPEYGPGQVIIPGVSTAAAHEALCTHAAASRRCVLLDGASNATASALATAAAAIAAADGAERAGIVAPWVTVPGSGASRDVPGSVIAAGLAARGDAYTGHANNAPAFDQGRFAGGVNRGLGVTVNYTDSEVDTMYDAGVSVIRNIRGLPELRGWVSPTDDDRFRQLNWGRFHMQLAYGLAALGEKFLGRQIDGRGHLYAEYAGAIRGYFLPLWSRSNPALYGETADDAFAVEVSGLNNTQTTVAAGELHADCEVSMSPHTEKVVINVVTFVAEGVAA